MRDVSISYVDGSTITGAQAILEQYEIALFTSPAEFSAAPEFGIGLEQWLAEANTEHTAKTIKAQIVAVTTAQFPEIAINRIAITRTQLMTIRIDLDVTVVPYGERHTISREVG